MGKVKDLTVYKKAFALAMEVFEITKKFPPEEKYSLTDQIRRSSRTVCVNLSEDIEKECIPHISFPSVQMLIWKIVKQ